MLYVCMTKDVVCCAFAAQGHEQLAAAVEALAARMRQRAKRGARATSGQLPEHEQLRAAFLGVWEQLQPPIPGLAVWPPDLLEGPRLGL
jgi:hypothetical protein